MIDGWNEPSDRLLARSVFGTDNPNTVCGMISDWAGGQGIGQAMVAALELSVGAAATLVLPDQTKVFVKVWPGTANFRSLIAQLEVQRGMSELGYPAPALLTKPSALGPGWAVAMQYSRPGAPTDARIPSIRGAMAAGLASFVSEAESFRNADGLPRRSLPSEVAIWPSPHNALFDFEATKRGAEWIDDIARHALEAMHAGTSRVVVGHCDWSAKNMRMQGNRIAVVYDWDAVFLEREAFMLGTAAAHFPVTWELDTPQTPSVGDVAAFVREYEQARDAAFSSSELAEIEAGITYARAYKARCEHAVDLEGVQWEGSSRESLRVNGPFHF